MSRRRRLTQNALSGRLQRHRSSGMNEYWVTFFQTCGFSSDVVRYYSLVFMQNEIVPDMLPSLNNQLLTDMGVFQVGRQLKILSMVKRALQYDDESSSENAEDLTIVSPRPSLRNVGNTPGVRRKNYTYVTYYLNTDLAVKQKLAPYNEISVMEFTKSVKNTHKLTEEFAVFKIENDKELEIVKSDTLLTNEEIYYVIYYSLLDTVRKKISKQLKKENLLTVPRSSGGKPVWDSDNSPILVDYIPEEELFLSELGRLGICMAPGRTKKKKKHEWNRSLALDLDRIKYFYHCDVLVSLVRHAELLEIEVPNLLEEVEQREMESIHFPIKDKWIPNSMLGLIELVEVIISRLKEGKTVVAHCNGGKGRSGTILVATLVGLGKGVDDAIEIVRKTRSGTIRNPLQIQYLHRFKKAWKKRKKDQSIKAQLNFAWRDESSDKSEDDSIDEWERYAMKIQSMEGGKKIKSEKKIVGEIVKNEKKGIKADQKYEKKAEKAEFKDARRVEKEERKAAKKLAKRKNHSQSEEPGTSDSE